MEVEIPTVRLSSTSAKMPLMGMGLWKIRQEDCAEAVYQAIKTGYRLFDGASDYGNEKEAGEGVKRAIANGLVRREDLFIVSKLWNTYHAAQHVRPACQRSLTDWGLEYFDLYLIHFPIALKYGEWHVPQRKLIIAEEYSRSGHTISSWLDQFRWESRD